MIGVAAAQSASALARRALPIREPTRPSLDLFLRKALAMMHPLNWVVGLPLLPINFSSIGGSKWKGLELPRLMQRDFFDWRSREDQEDGGCSVSEWMISSVWSARVFLFSSDVLSGLPSLSELRRRLYYKQCCFNLQNHANLQNPSLAQTTPVTWKSISRWARDLKYH